MIYDYFDYCYHYDCHCDSGIVIFFPEALVNYGLVPSPVGCDPGVSFGTLVLTAALLQEGLQTSLRNGPQTSPGGFALNTYVCVDFVFWCVLFWGGGVLWLKPAGNQFGVFQTRRKHRSAVS